MLPVIETFTEDMKQVNTLLQLATATRNILQKLTIKDIQVVTLPDNYFKFKFVTEDGTTIETNAVFIGEAISIDNVLSTISTNPVQNKVITEAINTINTAITSLQGTSLSSAEKEFVSSEYTKTQGPAGAVMHAENVEGDLLWENATPTSLFDAKSVFIDLTPYREIVIRFKKNNSADSFAYSEVRNTLLGGAYFVMIYPSDSALSFRQYVTYSDRITFTRGTDSPYNGSASYSDNVIIPIAIYGIK